MANGTYVETEEGEKTIFGYSCKFNEGVGCHILKRHCESCGWNPEVARERLFQICSAKGIIIPESVLASMYDCIPTRTEV